MSGLPFELMLALRYLRPKRTFVSIITLISVIGVTLGVGVLIIVISVMSGFDQQLRERILGFKPHLMVFRYGSPMEDYEKVAAVVSSNKLVKAVAPSIFFKVLVETQPPNGGSQMDAPFVRGIDPEAENKITALSRNMIAGSYDVRGNGILIGVEFARVMHLSVGDRVAIYSPANLKRMKDAHKQGKEVADLAPDYVVKGIFDLGYFDFNSQWLVCSLANAQDLFEMENSVNALLVNLEDSGQAALAKQQLLKTLGPDYVATTWMEENSTIIDAVIVEKNVMYYILFFIVLVAAFGITSALITFVVQKTREIGVLKALGATGGQIMVLFMGQSLVVGVLGVLCGCGFGMLALKYRNEFLVFMRQMTGKELFPASIYNFSELPALIVPWDIGIICGVSMLICLLAGLIPAYIASRLKPVEALRHE